MSKERNSDQEESAKNFVPFFTRDDVALGTAGFVAGLDVAFGALVPSRSVNPMVEGEMVFKQTLALLEKYLPGSKIGKRE